MLELKKIKKVYKTEGFTQTALNEVSISFRKNEFASILGPSGSGKTTLLNIVGGLDKYDSGDLIINGVSTKKYKDRDWDTYRNHKIGFVFQSYNLIGHQTILSNVELALTLSGVSKKERKERAIEALTKVGLKDHVNKRPNQLSGGQMQRVSIARALVNNPDILLADEPTGALDSETSVQIMNLLCEIAKEKLVIMVTHNDELAEEYSTRIVKLKDGVIINDTNPYDTTDSEVENKKSTDKHTSMNFMTALSLSMNNLLTKKWRTILTAFAGSIGIIGIAMILSLSTGVQDYIDRVQKETLSSYPLSIEANTIDFTSMMQNAKGMNDEVVTCNDNSVCTTDDITINPYLTMQSSIVSNNLNDFKSFLDNNGGNINDYTTDIQYSYDLDIQIYSTNTDNGVIRLNPNTFSVVPNMDSSMMDTSYMTSSTEAMMSTNVFKELISSKDLLTSQYELVAGTEPTAYNEVVLVVNEDNTIPASLMYSLDLEDRTDMASIIEKVTSGEDITLDSINYTYDDLLGTTFKLVLNTDYYSYDNGIYKNMTTDSEYMKNLVSNGTDLKIIGVMKVNKDAVTATSGYIGYTHDLTTHVINSINETDIVKAQKSSIDTDIFTGLAFNNYDTSYDKNLETLGSVDLENPSIINIYPKDFEAKTSIENVIKDYNKTVDEKNRISYTDIVGTLMSGIVSIIDVITYILIAFVAISLVVSSIMIAIITYISVLERTKEIGILRAVGASKKDVSRVFNAETVIEGFIAGFIGVGVTYLFSIPINKIVYSLFDVSNIASLHINHAIILILISVILTVVAGIVPSKMASKKDPAVALRTE